MVKHIDWEHPYIQQIFGQAIWNSEKGAWEVKLALTEITHTVKNDYVTIQNNFEVDVEACDELVLPVAIMQANGLLFNEILPDVITNNPIRDGKKVDF